MNLKLSPKNCSINNINKGQDYIGGISRYCIIMAQCTLRYCLFVLLFFSILEFQAARWPKNIAAPQCYWSAAHDRYPPPTPYPTPTKNGDF